MMPSRERKFNAIFPACRAFLGDEGWRRILREMGNEIGPERLPELLSAQEAGFALPGYVPELASLEWSLHEASTASAQLLEEVRQVTLNPTLRLFRASWRSLLSLLEGGEAASQPPDPGEELLLVWGDPRTRVAKVEVAADRSLLALKMVSEGLTSEEVGESQGVSRGAIAALLEEAIRKGMVLSPQSRIRRRADDFPAAPSTDDLYLTSPTFTLQWHVTQACDLRCQHCYDRSDRSVLTIDQGLKVLEDFREFCSSRHVQGHVSFTGGNPLLHPHFLELYGEASRRGFAVAVLGNPASRERLEEMISVEAPAFFQVSLEGLPEHNDVVRGQGHFERVMRFLDLLRELEIYSMVMATLTRDNMDQVLPLAQLLKDRTDSFTFNRLSRVGEGAGLKLPEPQDYRAFLRAYVEAAAENPILALKDNLFNTIHYQDGKPLFGGCTGYGCGAAFNFVAVLPDGEVHACRKFPSLIGNVFQNSLSEIYDSESARGYRAGPSGCRSCNIRPVCGGCLAVIRSHGLDVFKDRDPYCFMEVGGV